MRLENEFKRELIDALRSAGVWVEAYEPGRGSGVGYPDVQVLLGGWLVPVELKVGVLIGSVLSLKGDSEVRPSQVRWHHLFWKAGGRSIVLVGVQEADGAWTPYAIRGDILTRWRFSFGIEDWTKFEPLPFLSELLWFLEDLRSAR